MAATASRFTDIQAPSSLNLGANAAKDVSVAKKQIEVGHQTRAFSDEEIREAFVTFDLDHNSFVGAAEIKHLLGLIGETATDDEIDEMIRMCDADGDGQVTYDEFYKLMVNPQKERPLPAQPTIPVKKAPPKLTDIRGGGMGGELPQSRVAEVLRDVITQLAGGGRMKPSHIKKIYKSFQAVDKDNSGFVDYHEFLEVLKQKDSLIMKEVFKCFDLDFNGTVELKEFITVLSGFTTATKTDKLKFAFMMFDERGDGKLDKTQLSRIIRANFMTATISVTEADQKCADVYSHLRLIPTDHITYEQFMQVASEKLHLLYPLSGAATRTSLATSTV